MSAVYFCSAVKVLLIDISSHADKSNNWGPLISSPSSPSSSPHWWWWSWRALLQFGQWCMLLQVPEVFFSLIFGTGLIGDWLIRQTQGTDPQTQRELAPTFSCSCWWLMLSALGSASSPSTEEWVSHPEAEEEGSETPAVGRKAGVEDAFLRLKKAIFLSLFLLLELGLILFFTGEGTWVAKFPLVSKVKQVSPKLSLKEKSPPRYPKVLAMSITLALIGISFLWVLVAIVLLLGWGEKECLVSHRPHIAFTALWTWQKPASNWKILNQLGHVLLVLSTCIL